jgi:MFS family permease
MGKSNWWTYEYTVVAVHFCIWGFVALDRNIILYLFPMIAPEFNMTYTQVGMVAMILGLTWALSALFIGGLSDVVGRKKVILPATIAFSILSWVTGFVRNFYQLIIVRAVMGVPEGAYFPTGTATVAEEATPKRRGLMLGIHQMSYGVFGMLLAPVWAVSIATALGSWRWPLYLTIIPGVILALTFWRFIREPASIRARKEAAERGEKYETVSLEGKAMTWKDAIRHRNVIIGIFGSFLLMAWLYNFLSFATLFLTEVRQIAFVNTASIMAAFGLGATISYLSLGWVSDYVGRKKIVIIFPLLCAIATFLFAYAPVGGVLLYLWPFLMGLFGVGNLFLILSVITSESVPFALAGIAIGLLVFVGEVFGSIMPTIGGIVADHFGLTATMVISVICIALICVPSIWYKETAPRILAKRQIK